MKIFTTLTILFFIFINFAAAQTCDSLATTAGTATVSSESICLGDSLEMEITGHTTGTGLTIQWEVSTDSINWTPLSGANDSLHVIPSMSPTGQYYYRAMVTCGSNTVLSNSVAVSVGDPQVLSTTGDTSCGPGFITLQATASTGADLGWYAHPTGGATLGTGTSFTTTLLSDSTFYVEATTGGGGGITGIAPLPAQSTTFTGNVRGYWFTAPLSFTITGLRVPDATVDQSIAVVKFIPAVPPPVYTATTNDFTTLFLTQNNTNTGVIPVNIHIDAGDVIGILGQRGNVTAYAPSPNTTTIDGNSVTITRMGMQNSLTNTAPQNLFQEPASSIGLIEITYSTGSSGCSSGRLPVSAVFSPAIGATISSSSTNATAPNCNGSVFANTTGGTPPLTINWSSGTTTNLCEGWYTVTITDAKNCVLTDSVYVNLITGIEELNAAGISVYPNPVKDVLTIKSEKSIGKLEITNANGKKVYRRTIKGNSVELDLLELNAGIYFIKINNSRCIIVKHD
jgi:hypothetical protein